MLDIFAALTMKQLILFNIFQNKFISLGKYIFQGCIIAMLLFIITPSWGQQQRSSQAQTAIQLFDGGQYTEALPLFNNLVNKYPKDNLYKKYLGACIVETNGTLSQAVNYLEMYKVGEKLYWPELYLIKAYLRLFKVEEARKVLESLKRDMPYFEARKYGLAEMERYLNFLNFNISENEYGQVAEKVLLNIDILKNNAEAWFDLKYLKIGADSFCLVLVKNEELQPNTTYLLRKMPSKDNALYMSRFSAFGQWQQPEKFDAAFEGFTISNVFPPYIDQQKHVAYFSLEKKSQPTGFDIYMAEFTPKNLKQVKLKILPLPVNSPWNEYLYISFDTLSLLVSDRETSPQKAVQYLLQKQTKIDLANFKSYELYNFCFFKKSITKISLPQQKIETSKVLPSSYQDEEMVTQALEKQRIADSAMFVAYQIKIKIANTEDKKMRTTLFGEMKKAEKRAKTLQDEANGMYQQFIPALSAKSQEINKFSEVMSKSKNSEGDVVTKSDGSLVSYRIQLGLFSNPKPAVFFAGIDSVTSENVDNGKALRYFTPYYGTYPDADSMLTIVKSKGFKEAFIVAYYNKRKIPLERARQIEKE